MTYNEYTESRKNLITEANTVLSMKENWMKQMQKWKR